MAILEQVTSQEAIDLENNTALTTTIPSVV
jgi:hypothetical protein